MSETVFSQESELALVQKAQQLGFFVMLIVVCLDDPQRLVTRVADWVAEGGHAVPPERILAVGATTPNKVEKPSINPRQTAHASTQ